MTINKNMPLIIEKLLSLTDGMRGTGRQSAETMRSENKCRTIWPHYNNAHVNYISSLNI